MHELADAIGAEMVEKVNELLKEEYEAGKFNTDVELLATLQRVTPLAPGMLEKSMLVQLAIQRTVNESMKLGRRNIEAVIWGLINSIAHTAVVNGGVPVSAVIDAVTVACSQAEQYRDARQRRFAAGQFDAEVETAQMKVCHAHLEAAGAATSASATPFHVQGDGKVH